MPLSKEHFGDRPDVIENSIQILSTHARILDLLRLVRSPYALMNIHGGKGDRTERLIDVIRHLPDPIRLRLTLENIEIEAKQKERAIAKVRQEWLVAL